MNLEKEIFIASNRFGYGIGAAGLGKSVNNGRKALINQLNDPVIPYHLGDKSGIELSYRFLSAARKGNFKEIRRKIKKQLVNDYTSFISDAMLQRMRTKQPFIERLVAFWSNHFAVSIDKPAILGLIRDYEYRAIRPHISGKFEDMLIAVARHPAMLAYLDNWISFGENTIFARFGKRGLNENLGREILELHTLGVNGGYNQQDVIELAKMLTGWSVERRNRKPYPKFHFYKRGHEPGAKKLLGKTYKEDGVNEAVNALKDLARHPETARHLATKMAIHFISDNPPKSLIKKMQRAYLKNGGDLREMTRTMLESKESWETPLSKIKTTPDYVVCAFKTLDCKPKPVHIITSLDTMDFHPYKAPDPQGFSDKNDYWASPGAILKRAEWAQELAGRIMGRVNPYELGKRIFGSLMSAQTAFALKGAESQKQGLTILLMSPEFQRR